ncbi:MAG TPA: glycosyltransferase family 2 protein [Ktedonobacterales bacterium]|nr:glycosyltransferase family 2 protein [Ktedonobacterales bacterium]
MASGPDVARAADSDSTPSTASAPAAPDEPGVVAGAAGSAPLPGPLTWRGLSVVLPAYNEEAVIAQTVARCVAVLHQLAPDYEIIVVDDGSRDRTGEVAEALAAANPRIRVVHNRPNRGYGGALIAGFNAASKSLSFFMDADGQFDIADIGSLVRLREQGHRVVLGYREHRRDPLPRLVNAWGWKMLVGVLFGVRVRDVDCAFKLYDTNLVRILNVQSAGAMVNTEMLAKLAKMRVAWVEVPVRHLPRLHGSATGANLRVIARAFRELPHLRAKLRHWTATMPPEEPAPTPPSD